MKIKIATFLFTLFIGGVTIAQFPNPITLSTGQGTPGDQDPIWQCSPWSATVPGNPMFEAYGPTLINNNCAPGAWVDPASLTAPMNNGNWITGTEANCSANTTAGYRYFRLTLNLPPDCNGNSVTVQGSYVLSLVGYVDNYIHDVFINGNSQGISGGGFSPGAQLSIYLDGPWVVGTNYVDILVFNAFTSPPGAQNPYGLLLVADGTNSANMDSDGDGVNDLDDLCPCDFGTNIYGCPDPVANTCDIDLIRNTFLAAGCIELPLCYSDCSMYFLNPSPNSGSSAQAFAQTLGANLISIQDAQENECVMSELNRLNETGVIWIGFNDEAVEGTFVWYDQSPVTYTNWAPGEPNNSGGNEDCTQIYPDGMWNDLNCNTANAKSIIEVNLCPVITANDIIVCSNETATITTSDPILGSQPYTYSWSNGATTQSQTVPSVDAGYIVTVTDRYNCSVKDTLEVTAKPVPSVYVSDTLICSGESTSIQLSSDIAGTTFSWTAIPVNANGASGGSGNNIAQALNTAGSVNGSVTYAVTPTLDGCVGTTENAIVTVSALPVLTFSPASPDICQNDTVQITVSGANTYEWNPSTGLNTTVGNTVDAFPAGSQNYIVTGTNIDGCSGTGVVSVTVHVAQSVNAGTDQEICIGESVILSASPANPGTTFAWTGGVTDGSSFYPAQTDQYIVTSTDVNGCVSADSVTVTVHDLPIIDAGQNIYGCENDLITLSASGAGAGGTYTWDNNSVLNGVPFVSPVGTTVYTVIGRDLNGCESTDSLLVNIDQIPTPDFYSTQDGYCDPVMATFHNTSVGAQNCTWILDNGTILTGCGTVSSEYNQAGAHGVTLQIETNNGCPASLYQDSVVIIDAYPIASFNYEPQEVSSLNPEVEFTNTSWGASSYIWNFGDDGTVSSQESPVYTYPQETGGTYVVTLTAISENGCRDTISSVVRIAEELIFFVPNTFTPDGNQFNQTFEPVFTSGFDLHNYTLFIYNRWGEVLFESHDVSVGWDGTYGGKMSQQGTYLWRIEVKTILSDERKVYIGSVNLLR